MCANLAVWCVLAGAVLGADVVGADAEQITPWVYLPLDGSLQPAIGQDAVDAVSTVPSLAYRDGRRGQSARLASDCRLLRRASFPRKAGTVAFWIRPQWSGTDAKSHCLFSLYGDRALQQSWFQNRWTIVAGGGRLCYWVRGQGKNDHVSLAASIATWQPGQWHHVAVTWAGVNNDQPEAEFRLYVDGRVVDHREGVRFNVGEVNDLIDIGRDSDGSPDYAEADFDEFFVYRNALSNDDIRQAVATFDTPESLPAEGIADNVASAVDAGSEWRPGWGPSNRAYRCRVVVGPKLPTTDGTTACLLWDADRELAELGISTAIDMASVTVVACNEADDTCGKQGGALPCVVQDGAVYWPVPSGVSRQQPYAVYVYFDVVEFDTRRPLFVEKRIRHWNQPKKSTWNVSDYARDTYDDAWDFDEGDFEAIDGWGGPAKSIPTREVRDGALRLEVSGDPYFIWGAMWNPRQKTKRPVAIDLSKYGMLEMKIRQSCPRANWELYARDQEGDMLRHEFEVRGDQWQIVRMSLTDELRWHGMLTALRIDPTDEISHAEVAIDWVRLGNLVVAEREGVEMLGTPSGVASAIELQVPQRQTLVGSQQAVSLRVVDAQGVPVVGQAVSVRLAETANGRLEGAAPYRCLAAGERLRRGLTDADGRLQVTLVASRRAGPKTDIIEARADFAHADLNSYVVAQSAIDTQPGPPHHYQIAPQYTTCPKPAETPIEVTTQLTDADNNPLALAGRRVTLTVAGLVPNEPQSATTDAHGRATFVLRADPAKCSVYSLEAQDDTGCSGGPTRLTVVSTAQKAAPIRLLPNGYFARADGRAFVPLGGFYTNWTQEETPDGEWGRLMPFTDATDEQRRQWMKFLHDNGVNSMRFMLRTHRREGMEPMDVGGRVNQKLLAEALHYLDLAREFDLQFQLVIHEDYVKPVYCNRKHLETYALPAFAGEDLDKLTPEQRRFLRDFDIITPYTAKYTDPDARACQDRYVRELIPALRGNPLVFAYELENEMIDCTADWANHAVDALRAEDPDTLVCASHGGGGLFTADPLWWHRSVKLDFYTYHLYPHSCATNEQFDYGAAIDVLTRYGRMCGPSFLGESSGDQFRHHPRVDTRRWVMRDIIWLALTNGNPGVFFWNARGPEVAEFKLARAAIEQLDLTSLKRRQPEIGVDVRHPLDDDRWFRTPEGRAAYEMMGRYTQHYLSQGVDFDFTLQPERYSRSCNLDEFAPPQATRRWFETGPGWQLTYLAREDFSEVLVYVRNYAGTDEWVNERGNGRRWTQFLRKRSPAALKIALDLPENGYRVQVMDLDEKMSTTWECGAKDAIDLGVSEHDFGLVITLAPTALTPGPSP